MKRALIIPSAKNIVFEDNDIGEISPVLFPINGKTAFEYIYEKYNSFVDNIEIITQKDENLIKNNINSFNKRQNINVFTIDKLSDLGYTIYYGLVNSDCDKCYINFADSIVFDSITLHDNNCIYFTEEVVSNCWTFFDFDKDKITSVYDKSLQSDLLSKKSLFIGIFAIDDVKYFIKCLQESIFNESSNIDSFYSALLLYNKKYSFDFICVDNWLDIGHQDNYYNSKLEVCARCFNHIRLDKDRGIITKYSDNKEKLIDEISWYLKIPSDIQFLVPRIYSYSLDISNPYISMEYYSYHTIHELYLYGNLDIIKWKGIFNRIVFLLKEFNKHSLNVPDIKESLIDIYITKTFDRVNKLRQNESFESVFENNVKINGKTYCSVTQLLGLINEYTKTNLLGIDAFNIIHGDLCFSNILIDNNLNFLKLIDPRGRFGKQGIYGDSRYDLAKIFHCLDGKYDYIIKNMFDLNVPEDFELVYKVYDTKQNDSLLSVFVSCIDFEYNIDDIYFIEGLLFLSMIPLHSENLKQQYAMFCTAYIILNRIINLEI